MEKLLAEAGVTLPASKRVLFVDDEQDQLDVIEQILEGFCDVLTATSGPAALDLVEWQKVDVIIADQRMPGMSGVELLETVKEFHPLVVRIILTAYSDTDVIIQSINRCAVYRFLLKPWEPAQLRHTINAALEHKYARQGITMLVDELRRKKSELETALADLRASQEKVLHNDRLATIGKFAASMSHDLRHELFILMGVVSAMREMKMDENLLQMIELESMAIENLHNLAEGIYDYSRTERSGFAVAAEDVNAIVEEVITLMKWRSDFKHICWLTHLEPVPRWPMNRQKMKQLMINLLVNSAEAVDKKIGTIEIFTRVVERGRLQIEVRDNGRGIPDGLATEVWKPFFTTKDGISLGLGLDICRQIAELHGGRIFFRSAPEEGTSFYIEIPSGGVPLEEATHG
jgi:two-component system sensor histidine kinase/response regulator